MQNIVQQNPIIPRQNSQGFTFTYERVAGGDQKPPTATVNISRQLADLLAPRPRVRWRQDSEVRDCVARLVIGSFERSRRI